MQFIRIHESRLQSKFYRRQIFILWSQRIPFQRDFSTLGCGFQRISTNGSLELKKLFPQFGKCPPKVYRTELFYYQVPSNFCGFYIQRLPGIRTCTYSRVSVIRSYMAFPLDLLTKLRQKPSLLFEIQLFESSVIRSGFSPRGARFRLNSPQLFEVTLCERSSTENKIFRTKAQSNFLISNPLKFEILQ